MVEVRYRCELCPNGCEKIEKVKGIPVFDIKVYHQHKCHRYPSIMTDFKLVGTSQ
jgi:hypothetical protein